jgi:catechol 2,3-dioxygenase-like lactoylglutathione lyase family enzyme
MTRPEDAVGTLDHVVLLVADLDAGADLYRRLGFTLSPRGVHSAAMGTANHTIMLERDYFELMSVLAPTPRNTGWRARLAAGGGLAGAALTTTDAAAARDLWRAAGLGCDEPLPFARPVTRADGSTTEARFEVVTLDGEPDGAADVALRVFACAHFTRNAVWLPELTRHANTAVGLAGLTLAAADPAAVAAAWRRILPAAAIEPTADGTRVATGRHMITVRRDAAAVRPRAVGLDLRVADRDRCRAAFVAGGVRFVETPDRLAVAAADAFGVALGFLG